MLLFIILSTCINMTNRFMTSHAAGAPRRQGKRHIPGQGIRKEGVSGGGNGGAAAEWRLADTKEEEKNTSSAAPGIQGTQKQVTRRKIKRTQENSIRMLILK